MRMTRKNFISRASALGAMAALTLTACGSPSTQTTQNVQTSPSTSTSTSATPTPITEGKGAASRVANPAVKKLIAVSLSNPAAPKELMSVELPKVPNEILGVSSQSRHRLRLRHTVLKLAVLSLPQLLLTLTNPTRAAPTRPIDSKSL